MICGCGFKLNPSPHCTQPCTTPKPTCQMEYRHKQFISAMLQTKSTAEEEACGGDLINSSLLPRFSHFHGLTFIFQSSRYLMMVQGSPVMWGIHYVRGGGANGRPVVLFSTRSPRKSFHRCYKQDECWNLFYVCRFIYYIAQSGTGTIGLAKRYCCQIHIHWMCDPLVWQHFYYLMAFRSFWWPAVLTRIRIYLNIIIRSKFTKRNNWI